MNLGKSFVDIDGMRQAALAFSKKWAHASRESAEAQTFLVDFFQVFGTETVPAEHFEVPARRPDGGRGSIDCLLPGLLLVEMKSAGKSLDAGIQQGMEYVTGLSTSQMPPYVLACNFGEFLLRERTAAGEDVARFPLSELHENIERFLFLLNLGSHMPARQADLSIRASAMMGEIHDAFRAINYGEDLPLLLVRLVFCLFADSAGIFRRGLFASAVQRHRERGTAQDFGNWLAGLFGELDTPHDGRQHRTAAGSAPSVGDFPYVDGQLFEKAIAAPAFDDRTLALLWDACQFDWKGVSPAIFGSLFQSIMESGERRRHGAHYTTEENILKVIEPLFLDDLRAQLDVAGNDWKRLRSFLSRLERLRFFDPACGCGNFLVVAYREIRRLETEALYKLHRPDRKGFQMNVDIGGIEALDPGPRVNVSAFHGIELLRFPAEIAHLSLWLADHVANVELSRVFGDYYTRIPLPRSGPSIRTGNALAADWRNLLKGVTKGRDLVILGNPPYVGARIQTPDQKTDMVAVFGSMPRTRDLDYVAAWYEKAAGLMHGTKTRCAFVSTNSVAQGEQAAILWERLRERHGVDIHFAHQTFAWGSEAPGTAKVHVVIVGFACFKRNGKTLWKYPSAKGKPEAHPVPRISSYLTEYEFGVVNRTKPVCASVPTMLFGSMPVDNGHLLLDEKERKELLAQDPEARHFLRRFVSAWDYLHGVRRWCVWLADADPAEWRHLVGIRERVKRVQDARISSRLRGGEEIVPPHLFLSNRHPSSRYLLVPRVTSERRQWLPIGFLTPATVASDANLVIPRADIYHFGILSSAMHMAWLRSVGGRLKSDLRYSVEIVYNNFPWPRTVSPRSREAIVAAAQQVLECRKSHRGETMADLYDPVTMPSDLVVAHRALDRAVDRAYSRKVLKGEVERLCFLEKTLRRNNHGPGSQRHLG